MRRALYLEKHVTVKINEKAKLKQINVDMINKIRKSNLNKTTTVWLVT